MKLYKRITVVILFGMVLPGCMVCAQDVHPGLKAVPIDYQNSVDTESKSILHQNRKIYFFERAGVGVHNRFAGARLTNFVMVNDSLFDATISPENSPINPSPWYAFKVWSATVKLITIRLRYEEVNHRYPPKLSKNGVDWKTLDEKFVSISTDNKTAMIQVLTSPDTTWIAAQEIITSEAVAKWCEEQVTNHQNVVTMKVAGNSKLGRPLHYLDINKGERKNKKVIVILSRQHPPEVTGYFAMQAFVTGVFADHKFTEFLEHYRILVFPLLNPDGADLGHWRHNAGGVDLNRDWSQYRQEEISQIAIAIVAETATYPSSVIMGLDFHSTWEDVYYTNHHTTTHIPGLKDEWFMEIEKRIDGYTVNEKPSDPESPVSKAWFYKQFSAEGITYEIGDATDREFIKEKGEKSASALIHVLLKKKK